MMRLKSRLNARVKVAGDMRESSEKPDGLNPQRTDEVQTSDVFKYTTGTAAAVPLVFAG
jgi:hypothetical protein